MKKKSFWSRVGDFMLGKGFYMVLLLCVMAIGGSGYYLYHLATTSLAPTEQPVSGTAEVTVETEPVSDPEVALEITDAMRPTEEAAEETSEMKGESEALPAETETAQADETGEAAAEEAVQPVETPAEEAAAEPEAAVETVAEEPSQETGGTFTAPVSGDAVAAFSDSELTYNTALGDWRTHNGVDLAAELGDSVCAALDGEVLSVTEDYLLGTIITLNHGDGLMTVYGNLDPEVAVEQGDQVSAGQVIGTVGQSAVGEENEGAWLHFAVQQDGELVDPMAYLAAE